MPRRIHVPAVLPGEFALPPDQAHHLRDVLRLTQGTEIEIFDASGTTAIATLIHCTPHQVTVRTGSIHPSASATLQWTIASAIPKASRADWMIEKLSELGTAQFIPLITARSVVHPKGETKIDRWQRLATESAKQSRRIGVMQIHPPTQLKDALQENAWYLSPTPDAIPIPDAFQSKIENQKSKIPLTLFVGPEGGWSPDEEQLFKSKNLTPVALTATILRIETAAIAAASVLGCLSTKKSP